MRRPRLVIAALAALAVAPALASAATPRTLEVVARQGQEAPAVAAIRHEGGHVTLRRGQTLQAQLPNGKPRPSATRKSASKRKKKAKR